MTLGPGQIVGGKYRLLEPLAAGGMGSLWRARHADLEVDVAVKVMSKDLAGSEMAAERFKREARAAAMLKSPHVVQIHDYGLDAGQPYIAMELLDGEDLKARMRRVGAMSLGRTLELIVPICKALRLAHEAGIIHRDIKPANVFIARSGHDEVVKVLDFGIAKEEGALLAKAETSSSTVLGSPLYMSPEQARAGRVDHRTDSWSVAVVTFELLTGHHPFEGASLGDVFARICSDELPVPSSVGVEHTGLDAFFVKALARDPRERFASAVELSDAFAALALGVPEPVRLATPDVKPPPAATRKGRESDTLALAATAPAGAKDGRAPERSNRTQLLVGFALAGGVGALVAYVWRGAPPDPVAPAAVTSAAEEAAPPPSSAVGSVTAAAPVALEPSAPPPLSPPVPPPAASSVQPPSRAQPRALPPRPDAGASAGAKTAAPPSTAAPTSTSLDPVFGVPVTRP